MIVAACFLCTGFSLAAPAGEGVVAPNSREEQAPDSQSTAVTSPGAEDGTNQVADILYQTGFQYETGGGVEQD